MTLFKQGKDKLAEIPDEALPSLDCDLAKELFGGEREQAIGELELLESANEGFHSADFLAGKQTPLFFGSGVNNFGVQEVLDALVDYAPAPSDRQAKQRIVKPEEAAFTGVVFKIQANMDPAHRDRIAFVRVCSGKFERGMKIRVGRTGKDIRPGTVVSFLSQRRELLDVAYPGDIIGIPNHGTLHLGDSLTEGEDLQYTGLPFFAPEMFRAVEVKDPMRSKQLRTGLQQLGEEGAIQVFRPYLGGSLLLGAVGQLQFEVVQHRLKAEYSAEARIEGSKYNLARWVSCEDPTILKRFMEANAFRMAYDVVESPAFLAAHASELKLAADRFPEVKFHALREHASAVG